MVDDRSRGGEAITKVPRDEPTSVGGREEEIVENAEFLLAGNAGDDLMSF